MDEHVKTTCSECLKEIIVPTMNDFGIMFQTAPAKCDCGWEQTGLWVDKGRGFVADKPIGYTNLRSLGVGVE